MKIPQVPKWMGVVGFLWIAHGHGAKGDDLENFFSSNPTKWITESPCQGEAAEVVAVGEQKGMRFVADFAQVKDRCYWDLTGASLDLSNGKSLLASCRLENARALGRLSVYFKSGDGWYPKYYYNLKEGENDLSVNLKEFGIEDHPSGWNRIDGMRISPWKGAGSSTNSVALTFYNVRVSENPLVLLPRRAWYQVELPAASIALPAVPLEKNAQLQNQPGATLPFIPGRPVEVRTGKETLELPGALEFQEKTPLVAESLRALLARGICQTEGAKAVVRCESVEESDLARGLDERQSIRMRSPEAFKLEISPKQIRVQGHSREGVLRGLATLALMANHVRSAMGSALPCQTIWDAPQLTCRGWLVSGSPADLKRQIDILYLLRFNTVVFGVCSYGGPTAFPFQSHPDIGSGGTKEQWREVADYARDRGINPVPLFFAFSRCGYILNKPEYRDLAENPSASAGSVSGQSHDRNLCSANPKSYSLMFDLMKELIETMRLTDLHINLDENHYDDLNTCPICQKLHRQKSDWLVDVVNKTDDFLRAKNVTAWMWADNLDPNQNGEALDISGAPLLAKLPQDVVLLDWKYDEKESDRSVGLFVKAGFKTVSCSWYSAPNVAANIAASRKHGAYGFCGTSWDETRPEGIPPELVTAIGLGAYLSWSPEDCDLARLPVIPAVFYQEAAYRFGRRPIHAANSRSMPAAAELAQGAELASAMGLPDGSRMDWLGDAVTNNRGVKLELFRKDAQPAALLLKANAPSVQIPLSGKARNLTFLHCTNRKELNLDMHAMQNEYSDTMAGYYMLHYRDGTQVRLGLRYRWNISEWNDGLLANRVDPAIFGQVGGLYHVNIPTLTWENPHPEKELATLEVCAGKREGMNLLLFAVGLESSPLERLEN